MIMSVHLTPEEIELESFRIIDAEAGPHGWGPAEWPVIRRLIHTSADFEYLRTILLSPRLVTDAVTALRTIPLTAPVKPGRYTSY